MKFGNDINKDVDVSQEILDIVGTNKFYPYLYSKDPEDSEISWFCFGLFDTEELLSIGQRGNKIVYLKQKSRLINPAMIDRCFGIDKRDYDLAGEMSVKLYDEYFANNDGEDS